jgi:hypothetical protein
MTLPDVEDWEEMTTSENTYRRLNWQKGRQDWSRPSKLRAEIEKVTVDTLPEIYPKMRKHGWAILRDMTLHHYVRMYGLLRTGRLLLSPFVYLYHTCPDPESDLVRNTIHIIN